jgi:hypothetical protein
MSQAVDTSGRAGNLFQQFTPGSRVDILVQIADGGATVHGDGAGIRADIAGYNLEKRGLARTVLPDNGNAVSHADIETDTAEQRPGMIRLGYIRDAKHIVLF